jgi:hypothetical protein
MWRKIRARKFLQLKLMVNTLDPRNRSFDEAGGLNNFILVLCVDPERAFEKYAGHSLLPEKIKYLNQKFPRSSYQSTLEWAKAVIKEIATVLLPATRNLDPSEQKIEAEQQMFFAIIEGKEFFDDELNLRERLDAMIDRKVKHLIQLKAMKQMLRQTTAAREDNQKESRRGEASNRMARKARHAAAPKN